MPTSNLAPKCPIHNVDMVLRTARRGRNAGGQFWGCPTWNTTRCDKTFPLNGNGDDIIVAPTKMTVTLLPQPFSARPSTEGYQARFFQSAAVPRESIQFFLDEMPTIKHSWAYSQWRIDFRPIDAPSGLTERERQILSVAEKILLRGRITSCSPKLESKLRSLIGGSANNYTTPSVSTIFEFYNNEDRDYWLDSPPETKFYREILPTIGGKDIYRWTIPQVEIASLLRNTTDLEGSNQRVDFHIWRADAEPIIIEIDGEFHAQHREADSNRDNQLEQNGYRVFRIPAKEIELGGGPYLDALKAFLNPNELSDNTEHDDQGSFLKAVKVAHQIQVALLVCLQHGILNFQDCSHWHINSDISMGDWFDKKVAQGILKAAVTDFIEMLQTLGRLYTIQVCAGTPVLNQTSSRSDTNSNVHLSFFGHEKDGLVHIDIRDISVPVCIAAEGFSATSAFLDPPSKEDTEYFLRYVFNKEAFWEGQYDAISRTLQGKDSIVLLPTGSGKSISFQLAALLLPGRAIVVTPTISLMDDQVENLAWNGIDRSIAITSQIEDANTRSKIMKLFGQGEYLFAYVSPERFQMEDFRQSLRSLTTHTPVSLIAVDEAHCVSEWGHDFRTAYLNIGRTTRDLCEFSSVYPPLLALTGTASRAVLKDVQRELQIEDFEAIVTPKTFDRPELQFTLIQSQSSEKGARLEGLLGQTLPNKFSISRSGLYSANGANTYSGLVFCPHVKGDFGVVDVSKKISDGLNIPTSIYSGKGPNSDSSWNQTKKMNAKRFKANQVPLLVCTKSFGMGIDKPNIRYTVHYGIPSSIESFYQEAGRAGRDRKIAQCCIIVSNDDPVRTRRLLSPNTSAEEISTEIQSVGWGENDDITRALYFSTRSFPGIAKEMERIEKVLQAIGDISLRQKKRMRFTDLNQEEVEKSLHRLLVLGAVDDYTIAYATHEFQVSISGTAKNTLIDKYGKYVSGYLAGRKDVEIEKALELAASNHNEFVYGLVGLLIRFVYDVIEKGRRRTLSEMFLAASSSRGDTDFRQRILRYLESTQFSESLEQILAETDGGFLKTQTVFLEIRSPNDAAELRGQVSRYLQSYPDQPSLLMLRSLTEAYCRDRDRNVMLENFRASINSATTSYGLKGESLHAFICWALSMIAERDSEGAIDLQSEMLKIFPEREFALKLVKYSNMDLIELPASFLLESLVHEIESKLLI